jgi:L-methionine (R)-S-oxide reductase
MYDVLTRDIQNILGMYHGRDAIEKIVDVLYSRVAHYSWIGIYLVEGTDLLLGPWRGKQATEHTRIPIGKGICGAAAKSGRTEVIQDVHGDQRYLACFRSTKSEIVVPIKSRGHIMGEIDIDSDTSHAFTEEDKQFLEQLAGDTIFIEAVEEMREPA